MKQLTETTGPSALTESRASLDATQPHALQQLGNFPLDNWRAVTNTALVRPESAFWIMFADLLFFADSIPFLWPFLVIPSFLFGAGGVLGIEKLKTSGKPGQVLLRALLAGGLVALPTPIVGTLSGAVALMTRLAGWSPTEPEDTR